MDAFIVSSIRALLSSPSWAVVQSMDSGMSISGRLLIADAADSATICCIMEFMAAVMAAVYCSIAAVVDAAAVVLADVVGHADGVDDEDPFDIAAASYAPSRVPAGASSSSVSGILADLDNTVVDPGVFLLTAEASPRVTVNPVNPSGAPQSVINPSRRD